ncbi:molybdate ABC transporter permease subunit [Acinetobacter rathckeae]|uniref:molybdate ABC transporter permease subunit n=1 Tax=Acinetobacter rathckeae TaxID=2605272 RepID=UPI0018A25C52|nr:molybdate ABC transporter permease subunit [Acinetobacter rathckeae]MBF7687309.1 molybdate ABC transporter permease subunit [Acinetobacter rathckeae]MBF7696160.1 molybdate ABC transporter permease subunit [Acinetobacter rathckeae]
MLSPEALSAVYLSAKVAFFATLICLPFAILVAWWLARYEFRLKFLVDALLQLPLVLPPVVLGYLLLVVFGTQGILGQYLYALGIRLAFDWKGAVLASMVVAFPLMVQPIRLSFQHMNQQLEQVAASLGAAPLRVFFTISLPLALPGMMVGSILGFSRSLGEFGATITFVGNIPNETRTLPIAIYSLLQQPDGEMMAMRLVVLSLILAFLALIANYFIVQKYQRKIGA